MHQSTAMSVFDPCRFLTWSIARSAPLESESEDAAAGMTGLQLDQLSVLACEGRGEQEGYRRPDHIRSDNADYFVLTIPLSAELNIRQNGRSARILPGFCAFVSTTRPSQASLRSFDTDVFRSLHIRIPGPLLRRQLPDADDLCGREIPASQGIGAVLSQLVEGAITQGPSLSASESKAAGNAVLCLICSVASSAVDSILGRHLNRDSASMRTYDRAIAYIEARLSDPSLSIDAIALHCQVSVRYLHAVFASCSTTTVAAYVRERRLQGCRVALLHPSRRQRSIIEVAGDWGFEDPSQFSHAYKARFGTTPRQDRKRGAVTEQRTSNGTPVTPHIHLKSAFR